MKVCVYGGLFGSEGKGCVAEWFATKRRRDGTKLVVFGENSPNSGHTCSAGKTQNIPASSFFADGVVLGPDSVIDPDILLADLERVNTWRAAVGKRPVELYIHEHAGLLLEGDREHERGAVERVSSTGSGSGAARVAKSFGRHAERVLVHNTELVQRLGKVGVRFLTRYQWFTFIQSVRADDWLFECSQGSLLDTNWGYYPHVTARTTLPRAAIDRNGLSGFPWEYAGVYRTFPIRTGGPSGPTGSREIKWEDLGVPQEVASVTKRIRRVFEPSAEDLWLSLQLTMPHYLFMTHCDYISQGMDMDRPDVIVEAFLSHIDEWCLDLGQYPQRELYISHKPSEFTYVSLAALRASSGE